MVDREAHLVRYLGTSSGLPFKTRRGMFCSVYHSTTFPPNDAHGGSTRYAPGSVESAGDDA